MISSVGCVVECVSGIVAGVAGVVAGRKGRLFKAAPRTRELWPAMLLTIRDDDIGTELKPQMRASPRNCDICNVCVTPLSGMAHACPCSCCFPCSAWAHSGPRCAPSPPLIKQQVMAKKKALPSRSLSASIVGDAVVSSLFVLGSSLISEVRAQRRPWPCSCCMRPCDHAAACYCNFGPPITSVWITAPAAASARASTNHDHTHAMFAHRGLR